MNVGSHGDTLGRTSQGPGQERALGRVASAVWCHPSPTAGYTAGGRGSYTGHSSTPRGEEREEEKRKKVKVEGKGRRCREKEANRRGRRRGEGDERRWRKSGERERVCKKREKWRRSLLGLAQSFNQPVCLPH